MNSEFYKDKTEHDWRLKFTVDDYFEHPEYWSYEVELPKWADELYSHGYKGICALDFYDEVFNDDDIAPKVEGKKFQRGQYSPKILKITQKPKEQWTPKEQEKMDIWLKQNPDADRLEILFLEMRKLYLQLSHIKPDACNEYRMPDGKCVSHSKWEESVAKALMMSVGAETQLKNYRKDHKAKPNFVKTRVDYIFQEKENLWDTISYSEPTDFLVIRPVSYAGRSMEIKDARFLHAIVIEIDGLKVKNGEPQGLNELLFSFEREYKALPKPTYIVCSGSGVHLYFVFERPVPLFKNVMEELNEMRFWLVSQFWNSYVSEEKVQTETLTQGFRVVGSYAKNHHSLVCAFKVGKKVSLEYLNSFVPADKQVSVVYKRTGLSRAEAKEKYPQWYEDRIVKNKPKNVWTLKGPWMYYWWRNKMIEEAVEGCRGYMLENLCALALKCNISEEELDRDLDMLLGEMEAKTVSDDNHFTELDLERAKRTFEEGKFNAYARRVDYLRNKFEPFGIKIPETKRNHRKQPEHLEEARVLRDLRCKRRGVKWDDNNGRPDKKAVVQAWRHDHPEGTKYQCSKDTGLSKNTVKKWWDS